MLIAVDNLRAYTKEAAPVELKWLDSILSFKDGSYKARMYGDGYMHLLDKRNNSFPAGLVGAVRKRAKKDGKRVDLVDRRLRPVSPDPQALVDWLRPHQVDALAAAKEHPRGVFHHVTGAGKTEIMVALTEVYPTRWLLLVNKKDLLYQIADRFAARTGERVGIIGDGKLQFDRRITVAMFQSLSSGMTGQLAKKFGAFLQGIRAVGVDECHVTPAATYWRVMMSLPNAYYRYGFSGTPFSRGDQKSLYVIATLGPTIHRVSAEQLAGVGLLARPKIRLVPVTHQASTATTWTSVYNECVVENPDRNAALVKIAKHAAKPSLLFVKSIAHGRTMTKLLEEAGLHAEFTWGEKKTPQRQAAIRRLVHGDVDVLICNVIFQEGIDIPELMSVIIGAGGKSTIAVLQDIGRGMRRHSMDGSVVKDEFEVFDIQDLGCGCRNRHKSCKWLGRHTQDRLRAFAIEKYPVFVTPVSKLEGG